MLWHGASNHIYEMKKIIVLILMFKHLIEQVFHEVSVMLQKIPHYIETIHLIGDGLQVLVSVAENTYIKKISADY